VFGRRESLRELVRNQHEETLCFMKESREESRRREERLDKLLEETREFNREILLRNEKVYTRVLVELEEGRKQLEEGIKQIRANTQAVLSMLDRFDDSGGATAS
jgi:hypothetical protein